MELICDDKNSTIPCPDLISLGTTQLPHRFNRGETLNLNNYFTKYFKKTGISIEGLINKYSYFDYRIGNNWLALPIVADIRPLRFNKTTFDYCIKKGYDIHYPPPYSNYWGSNYQKTWTWEKAFEYAKLIKNCTGLPGFRIFGNKSEDTKFFIQLCQSIGVPFLIEDPDLNIKKCGFRNKDHIKKLEIIRELFEDHNIEPWLYEPLIEKWKTEKYPSSVEEQPILMLDPEVFHYGSSYFIGLSLDGYVGTVISGLYYSYVPGTSSFLGGQGIVITKKSKYPDQAFEYLEQFLNATYPYTSLMNVSVSPYSNIPGKDCKLSTAKKTNKELCNSLINKNGIIPHYYVYNNKTEIAYLKYEVISSKGRVRFNKERTVNNISLFTNITNMYFQCDDYSDYYGKKITVYEKDSLQLPLNENEFIILKSMKNYKENNEDLDSKQDMCSIFNDALNKAKPIQFPYNTFSEINEFEMRSPISILLAHLYYNFNGTHEQTFEDIINECCDIIDDSFLPFCKEGSNVKFEFNECNPETEMQNIHYLNCKNYDKDTKLPILPTIKKCTYIPYSNFKGKILISTGIISSIIEVIIFIIITIYRNEKCIHIVGYHYLILLILSTVLMYISAILWIGENTKFKCIFKLWLMIIGIFGFICSYSIKANAIITVYNNNNMKSVNKKSKDIFYYITIFIIQIFLLSIWSIFHKGLNIKHSKLFNIGYYDYSVCSYGDKNIITIIFLIDYILVLISIISAYKGRNIPSQFNFSKNNLIISIITLFLLSLCYIISLLDIDSLKGNYITTILIIVTALLINLIFVGSKLLIIFNIGNVDSIVIVTNRNSNNLTLNPDTF
ncbi:hypothetical protein U3516DRAFT_15133 [Neocallimastix sp. 'constans']